MPHTTKKQYMEKPIRILIIVENLPVPFDTRVWKEALSLREHGYDVRVICPKGRGFERSRETLDGIEIYRHWMPVEGHGALGYFLEYGCASFFEFIYSWWVFLRHGFDVIQGCNPPDTIFAIAAPFKLFGVKYIFDHHDVCPELFQAKFGSGGLMYRIQCWLEQLTFKTSNVVISTNQTYRNIAITRGGLDPENVFVVRNGPDIEKFKAVAPNPAHKMGRTYLVGYVGTMAVQEGLDVLLEVAKNIRDRGRSDVHFICVGGGPELRELRSMCKAMGLDDTVDFPGRVSDEDLLEILSTADVCVNPDKVNEMNDMSTMIKIMEYMALEKPIVQFDLKEGRFSAQDAALYAADSVDDFANKILWLFDHPEERRRMGDFGRRRVTDELAWQHSVPHLLSAYARALAS